MKLPLSLPSNKSFDAVGFGLNAVDHLIVVSEYPAFDTKVRLREHKLSAGGQTATAMVSLQRLGMKTAYAGKFGSDTAGEFGLNTLIREGVNVDHAVRIEGATNQIAFIIIDARNGERTIIWDRDDKLAYEPHEAPLSFGTLGRVLHLDAHDPLACTRVARVAKESGTIVSADIDNIYDGLPDLLPFIDVLITSKEFPHRLTGIADERAALVEMKARYGCAVVGITKGIAGATIYSGGQFFESLAFEVPGGCHDTTGAGDAFHAGFIYGVLQNDDVEHCLELGNALASLKCRSLGARTSLPTRTELNQFLQTGKKINRAT